MHGIFYRVEHRTATYEPVFQGPYHQIFTGPLEEHSYFSQMDIRPTTISAFGRPASESEFHGFSTRRQAREWFRRKKDRAWLEDHGFVVRKYRGEVTRGKRQSLLDTSKPFERLGEVVLW